MMLRCHCQTATLLAIHAALGQRWVCLPVAVWWVTQSVVVAYSFAGQFAAWSLLVLAADCVCIDQLVETVPPSDDASRSTSRRVGLRAAAIASMATLIAWCVPIVGPAAALGTGTYFAATVALAAQRRQSRYIYFAWALVESLLGVAGGCALYFTRTLYADKMDVAMPGWRWLVLLYGINCAMGFISAVLQVVIVLDISRTSSRATAESFGRRAGDIALLPIGVEQRPDAFDGTSSVDDEKAQDIQEIVNVDSFRRYGRLGYVAWSGILLFFTVGWLATQLFPPGETWPEPPACKLDCFCKPLAVLSNENLPDDRDANISDGVQTIHNLPFDQAVLRRQDLRLVGCNPNRSPCLFNHQPPDVEERAVTLYLDLYRPWRGIDQSGYQRPAVVLAHPGGFSRGAKNDSLMSEEATYFAKHGFIAVAIDYRLEAASFLPEDGAVRDAIADTKAAVRWLRQNKQLYGVDPQRIAVWGASAGGIIAGTIGFTHDGENSASNQVYSSKVAAAVAVSGCLWSSVLDEGAASWAARGGIVPYLDIHGEADVQVGTWDSVFTYKYLESLGVPDENNRLVVVPGGGHVPWGAVEKERLRPVVLDFLVRQLRLEEYADCKGL